MTARASAGRPDNREQVPATVARRFWSFVAGVTLAGGGLFVAILCQIAPGAIGQLGASGVLVAALLVVGELRPMVTAGRTDTTGVQISLAFAFALLLRWGLETAVLALAAGTLISDLVRSRAAWRSAFNIAQQTLSLGAAQGVLLLLHAAATTSGPRDVARDNLLDFVLAGTAYLLTNNVFVARAVSLHADRPFFATLRTDIAHDLVVTSALFAMSPLIVLAAQAGPSFVPLLVPPLAAVYLTASLSLEKEHQSLHDALTGLPNRKLLTERLAEAVDDARVSGGSVAYCLLDVDRFKEVNDTLGHAAGDRLLKAIGERLRGCLRDGDTVARLGGDEFGLVLPHITDGDEASRIAARCLAAIVEPFPLEGMEVVVDGSIGIALYPRHADESDALLKHADAAMYVAKREREGLHVFELDDEASRSRLGLLAELRRALDGGDIDLAYQPKVSLEDGSLVGAEVLLRWTHPTRGLVPADEFLPLAEQTGLMREVTAYVLGRALDQQATWRAQGVPVAVAVNVTARDLLAPGFADEVGAELRRRELPAGLLSLEITERSMLGEQPSATTALNSLAAMGVGLSLDDFGTGYSSLSHLARVPVTELKIDRSFVMGAGRDPQSTAIVRTVVELGHSLGVTVVAEGVESQATWDALRAIGCDDAQGWLVAPAMPAETFLAWASERDHAPAVGSSRRRRLRSLPA
ncbi:MAG TPA: EAL domain-containing protein [Mycobacteriales bacterium]|nr:EAL domain-containing protein [Mycobacteriales bacterium]